MTREPGNPMPRPTGCGRVGNAPGHWPCVLKPDFVFFDEMIPPEAHLNAARLVEGADLILVAGTSCEVYPAADIPQQVRRQGGRVIEINLEPAPALAADLVLQGPFSILAAGLYQYWGEMKS